MISLRKWIARRVPAPPELAEQAIRACKAAGVAAFFKQAGARPMRMLHPVGAPEGEWEPVRLRLADKKGGDLAELPQDLQVREYPRAGASDGARRPDDRAAHRR